MSRRNWQALPAAAFDRYHQPYQWWLTTPQPGELEYLGGARNRMRTDSKPARKVDPSTGKPVDFYARARARFDALNLTQWMDAT